MHLAVAAGQTIRIGLRYESGSGQVDTAARFRALLLNGSAVQGGNTYVLRFR
jgi:hypothetical protein